MIEAPKNAEEQQDGPGLDEMLGEWEAEQAEAEELENQPDPSEVERAKELAEKMNTGFLWIVNRTQCPHVRIDQVIDPDQGAEAFQPLAERFGGEVPPWLLQFQPYIAAGVYMGQVIITARQAEAQAIEMIEAQKQQGGANGQEPGPQQGE